MTWFILPTSLLGGRRVVSTTCMISGSSTADDRYCTSSDEKIRVRTTCTKSKNQVRVLSREVDQQTAIITHQSKKKIKKILRFLFLQHTIQKVNTIKMKFFLALATIGSAAAYSSSS